MNHLPYISFSTISLYFLFFLNIHGFSQEFNWTWAGKWKPELDIKVDTLQGYENHYDLRIKSPDLFPEKGRDTIYVGSKKKGHLNFRIFDSYSYNPVSAYIDFSTLSEEVTPADLEKLMKLYDRLRSEDSLSKPEKDRFISEIFAAIPEKDEYEWDGPLLRNHFPFANALTVPGRIKSTTDRGDYYEIKGSLLSVKMEADAPQFGPIEGLMYDPAIVKEDKVVPFTLKVPFELGKHLQNSRNISGDSDGWKDRWNFLFNSVTMQLKAIEMGQIIAGGRIDYDWNYEYSDPQLHQQQDFQLIEKTGRWQLLKAPKNCLVRVKVDGMTLRFRKNDVAVWEDLGNGANPFYGTIDSYAFWYTPQGITIYATKVAQGPAAGDPILTSLTHSFVAQEEFEDWHAASTDGRLQVFPSTKKIKAPNGFNILEKPDSKSNVVKTVDESTVVNVRAYVDYGSNRFFISDWSFERRASGHSPYYIFFK